MSAAAVPLLDDVAAAFDPQRMFDHPDPYPLFARLRRTAPVAPIDLPGRRLWAASRWSEVRAVLADPATFVQPSIGRVIFGQSRRQRAERHAHARAVVAHGLTPHAVARLAPFVTATAHRLLDDVARSERVDLYRTFARLLPLAVVGEVIGIPTDEPDRLLGWSHDVIGLGKDPRRGTASAQALDRWVTPIVQARRRQPRDDLISRLVRDGGFADVDVAGFLRVLIPAAADPPAQMLGSLLVALLTEPSRWDRLRDDRGFVANAVTEALRWETPIVYVVRQATRPVELGDVPLAAGADVCAIIGSANRDETRFDDPDRFDLERRIESHLAFGYGRHFCLGSHLSPLIGRLGVEALLDRMPGLRLDPDAPPPRILGFAFRTPDAVPVRTR